MSKPRAILLTTLIELKPDQPLWRLFDRLTDDKMELLAELIRSNSISVSKVDHCHTTMLDIKKLPH